MLLFAPADLPPLDRLSSRIAAHPLTRHLPRQLQLLAVIRAASFTAHTLAHWMPGAGLPDAQRARAIWHAMGAGLPAVAWRVHQAMACQTLGQPCGPATLPAFDPSATTLRLHARSRAQEQQRITPQVPLQHLLPYLQYHLNYSESTFTWLLQQYGNLQAHALPHRLAGTWLLWQLAAGQSPCAVQTQALLSHARQVLNHESAAIASLPGSTLLHWQMVLAECAVACWETRNPMQQQLAHLLLQPTALPLAA